MINNEGQVLDSDAKGDPFITEYKLARDLMKGADWPRGLKELEGLAHEGSVMSILFIADAMREGTFYDKDLPNAEDWYRVAVEAGFVRGVFGLGITHLRMGRFAEAIQDLEAAGARSYAPAYNSLAAIYFHGDGVIVDRQRALDLWRKAASLGNIPAQRNLVHQFIRGRYGFRKRVEGWAKIFPLAFEIMKLEREAPDSDRLR